jgi:hypothetical protein
MSATYRTNYRRRLYPPPPSVEDEATSLAREYPPSVADDSNSSVPSRGTVDQEHLLDLVDNPERRYVLVSESSSSSNESAPRHHASGPRRLSNRNPDTPPLAGDVDPAVLDRRQPSPYTFTPASAAGRNGTDCFLSPGVARHPSARRPSPAAQTSPNRSLSQANRGRNSDQSDDSEPDGRNKSTNRRPYAESGPTLPRKVSFAGQADSADTPRRDPSRTSARTAAAAAAGVGAAVIGEHAASGRPKLGRNTENSSGRADRRADYPEARAPGLSETPPSPFRGRTANSRPDSPQGLWDRLPTEPPRYAAEFDLPTHPRPRNPPRPPGSSGAPNQDYYRSPYPGDYLQGGSALPYPDENPMLSMPEHVHFQYMPDAYPDIPAPRSFPHTANPSNATINDPLAESFLRPRNAPPMSRNGSRSDNDNGPRPQRSSASAGGMPWLPPCPRKDYVAGFYDWYSLEGSPDFHVCPSCLHEIIEPTRFRHFFQPSNPRSTEGQVRCDFGKPWVRIAFLQCEKYHNDLDLIADIVELSREEHLHPCRGHEEMVRTWYGIEDDDGEFVPNFYLCSIDKANVEILFPSLEGAFKRRPSHNPHVCSLRTGGRRFKTYVDLLDAIQEDALHMARTAPAPSVHGRRPAAGAAPPAGKRLLKPLKELAATIAAMPECPRDRLVAADTPWHVLAGHPDTPVCRECYSEVVRPALARGSRVAAAFARDPAPLGPAAGATAPPTCQLYSERMQAVWERAVRDDDAALLARAIRERRAREAEVKRRRVDLERLLRGVEARAYHGPGGAIERQEDLELVERNLEKNEDEWRLWE